MIRAWWLHSGNEGAAHLDANSLSQLSQINSGPTHCIAFLTNPLPQRPHPGVEKVGLCFRTLGSFLGHHYHQRHHHIDGHYGSHQSQYQSGKMHFLNLHWDQHCKTLVKTQRDCDDDGATTESDDSHGFDYEHGVSWLTDPLLGSSKPRGGSEKINCMQGTLLIALQLNVQGANYPVVHCCTIFEIWVVKYSTGWWGHIWGCIL